MLNFKDISKNTGYNIFFEHIATKKKVDFPGFITDISDNFQVTWQPTDVYGRMDSILTYQKTSRSMTLAFDVLSHSPENAKENLRTLREFTRMMYPKVSSVDQGGFARVLKAPPLMKVRFANLIQSSATGDGLLVALKGFNWKPALATGWVKGSQGLIFSREFNISLTMEVLHEHDLGFDEENGWIGGEEFPWADEQVNFEQIATTEASTTSGDSDSPVSTSRANQITGGSEE